MESSDDDKPMALIAAARIMNIPKAAVRTAPVKRTAMTIDSDDDDIPLAVLMKRKLETTQKSVVNIAPPVKKVKADIIGSKNPSRKVNENKNKSKSKSKQSSKSSVMNASSQSSRVSAFYESDKGKVVQALMIRWWYAIQWPDAGAKMVAPPGFESLDGFPGVFVGTRLDNFGEIKDLRDKTTCPNFKNLWAKSTEELKDLCETAIKEQIKTLVEAEGPNTRLERSLVQELKQVQAINAVQADKKALKIN